MKAFKSVLIFSLFMIICLAAVHPCASAENVKYIDVTQSNVGSAVYQYNSTLQSKKSDGFVSVVQTDSYYGATTIGLKADGTVEVFGKTEFLNSDPAEWTDIESIASGGNLVVGLKSDGTVVASMVYLANDDSLEKLEEAEKWENIVEIDPAGDLVALKSDGTIVVPNEYEYYYMNYLYSDGGKAEHDDPSKWENMVYITTASCYNGSYIFGLTKDGTVKGVGETLSVKEDEFAKEWSEENVVSVDSSGWLTIAVKEDGTVSAAGEDAERLQDELSAWSDISKAYAGDTMAVGLKKDGTAVYTDPTTGGENLSELKNWTDIEEVYGVKENIIVGLKSDGTLVCADRYNGYGSYQLGYSIDELETWTDIVDVSVTRDHIVGIKSDGTLIAIGNNDNGQCDVNGAGSQAPVKTPSAADLDAVGENITYPKDDSYLPAYKTMYVKAPKGHAIYVFWRSNGKMDNKRNYVYAYENDEVTVIAEENGRSCIIFTDKKGKQRTGWVNSDYLVASY